MLHIVENVSLKKYNTFGVAVNARYFTEITKVNELEELFASPQWQSVPRLILGGGSNMLFSKDYDGLVVRMNIKGIDSRVDGADIYVNVGAGEVWNEFVSYCVGHGYAGVENLTLIPGSVGASPIQNIGAYGVELKDVFHSCKAFEIATGKVQVFDRADCKFAYRESVFKNELKGKFVIIEVTFKLSGQANINTKYGAIEDELGKRGITAPTIKDISSVVADIRVSKLPDPSTIGNAGSFFKNPIISNKEFQQLHLKFPAIVHFAAGAEHTKLAAGWLIEQCGWKGKVQGNTGTWKNQALVLVNHGGATGNEIYDFSTQIIESVYNRYGVRLEREVNVI